MLAILFTVALPREAISQYELPVITNERGDTIHYTWLLADSSLCITNTITVKFNLDIPTAPVIKIHNELGIVVYKEQSEILMPGNYDRVLDVSSLPSGIYLIEINQGTKQNINKLIINK